MAQPHRDMGGRPSHPRSFASFESVIQSFAPFESVVLSGAAWGHANLQGSWGKRSEGSASYDCDQVPPMAQSHRDMARDQIIHDLSHHFDRVILSGAAWGHANLQGSWGKRSEGSASYDCGPMPTHGAVSSQHRRETKSSPVPLHVLSVRRNFCQERRRAPALQPAHSKLQIP